MVVLSLRMFRGLKKRAVQAWQQVDWSWRLIIVATATGGLAALLVISVLVYTNGHSSYRALLANADILSAWLVEKNVEALMSGRPETADLKTVSKQSLVRRAIIFDVDGKVWAPVSMFGDHFSDNRRFKDLMSRRSMTTVWRDKDYLEVFRPVSDSSGSVYGLAYVELDFPKVSGWGGLWVAIMVIVSLFAFFAFWVVRDTPRSIRAAVGLGGPRRFNAAHQILELMLQRNAEKLFSDFETEWRGLIHMVDQPVIILDRLYRLVEMNKAAVGRFNDQTRLSEGRHIIEVMGNSRFREVLTRMLEHLSESAESMIMAKEGDLSIAIFSSGSKESRFKFTIVFSGKVESLI